MPTNFLEAAGTNGLITSPFSLMTTELNALASGAAATSSVGGTSGVFSQSNWASALIGAAYFEAGGAFTPTAGGIIAGWFLRSYDGGTNFETLIATPSTTVMALGRAPDFIIPAYEGGAAWASGNRRWTQGRFRPPEESHKVVLQNLTGAALPSTGNLLKGLAMTFQY